MSVVVIGGVQVRNNWAHIERTKKKKKQQNEKTKTKRIVCVCAPPKTGRSSKYSFLGVFRPPSHFINCELVALQALHSSKDWRACIADQLCSNVTGSGCVATKADSFSSKSFANDGEKFQQTRRYDIRDIQDVFVWNLDNQTKWGQTHMSSF